MSATPWWSMSLVDRLLSRVSPEPNTGCWLWFGAMREDGYGKMLLRSRQTRPHIIAYEVFVGPVPQGLVLDHLCRERSCCNPRHLEAVTPRVNILRGVSTSARNAAKTHCKHGHEFTPENTRRVRGGRHCVTCERRWTREACARVSEQRRVAREGRTGVRR